MHTIVLHDQPDWEAVKALVLDSVSSPHTKRSYNQALTEFLAWYRSEPRPPFSRAVVHSHRAYLEARGLAPGTVNIRLTAIRKLAMEAADNGLMDMHLASAIVRIKGPRRHGVRLGNWLTARQAENLINAPDPRKLKGKRDRALLTLLIGCGLRRSEAANLGVDHVQQREGRWVIVDLVGKHGRVRSVPMPPWAKAALDSWQAAAGFEQGRVFRPINKAGRLVGTQMSGKCIADAIKRYARPLGLKIAAHDLRRTYAKLAHQGRAALEQIQLSLGHASLTTTERYLGVEQDLTDAPCDHIKLNLNGST